MAQKSFPYRVVDVFSDRPLEGNPLAVFLDGTPFEGSLMQKIAKELNLSETVFVLPPTRADCVARLRIFTPHRELLFAGHPTVGTSFVLIDEGRTPAGRSEFNVEEGVGAVPVRVDPDEDPLIWLTTPPIEAGPKYDAPSCANALGLSSSETLPVPPQILSAGNPTLFIPLKSKEAVDEAWLDTSAMRTIRNSYGKPFCVFVFALVPEGVYSRMFAPEYGVIEDPATGSSTGPLALFMMRNGLISDVDGTRFVSEQGVKMGRRSLLHVEIRGAGGADGIAVGGHVTPLIEAKITLRE